MPVAGHRVYQTASNGPPPPPEVVYYGGQPTTTAAARRSDAAAFSKFPKRPTANVMSTNGHHPAPPRVTAEAARAVPDDCPSYYVEHLATFGVGSQFGLQCPSDGIGKLKQMERSSAIWAQRMVLRLQPNALVVLDENGDAVENFPLELISEPTAHVSNDVRDLYNNLLLFVVNENANRGTKKKAPSAPTEMHIFQCVQVSAAQVAEDIRLYLRGQYREVAPGRRGGERSDMLDTGATYARSFDQTSRMMSPQLPVDEAMRYRDADQKSTVSDSSTEFFERDVNTLNRCFDEIERFVARIQSAAIAQRELEALQRHRRAATKGSAKGSAKTPLRHPNDGILMMRAQLPTELEFYDVLQKFKLCFNLLAKLKNHIHDPNAPELLHFLFTPLAIILDASQWAFGRNLAPQVVSPLISRAAKSLLLNCLTSKESEVWASLGDCWRITADEWRGPVPGTGAPSFVDSGAYMADVRPSQNPPSTANMVDAQLSGQMNRVSLERERLDFEKEKLHEEERRLMVQKRALDEERRRLLEEKRQFYEEQEQRSVISERIVRPPPPNGLYSSATLSRSRPELYKDIAREELRRDTNDAVQQRAFADELRNRGAKMAQVSYERPGQNSKELSVRKGEFLQVLDNRKNWWHCRNAFGQEGFVPHTILSPTDYSQSKSSRSFEEPLFVRPPAASTTSTFGGGDLSAKDGMRRTNNNGSPPQLATSNGDTPDAVRQRRGKLDSTNGDACAYASNTLNRRPATLSPVACRPPVAPPLPDFGKQLGAFVGKAAAATTIKSDAEAGPRSPGRDLSNVSDTQRRFSEELQQTLKRSQTSTVVKLRSSDGRQGVVRMQELSCVSNSQDVVDWLRAKGFSNEAVQALRQHDGEALLKMTKSRMLEICGADEGARLYDQIGLQKGGGELLDANKSRSAANELESVLAARRSMMTANAAATSDVTESDDQDEDEDTVTIAL